jgi:tetratricopeptide (TPR) repeat protein
MKSNIFARSAAGGLFLLVFLTGAALAEIPDTFSNLEVFPKDIGKRQLLGAMRDFSSALGVKCTFCHIQKVPGEFDSIDWASDQLEHKQTARGMMNMTRNINSELLPAATGAPGGRVTCITCHRGLEDPRTLRDVLLDTIEKDGAETGAARYQELAEEDYGSGSYDFSPSTLTGVAETLAQSRGDMDGAVVILDLAVEVNPDDVATHLMRSQLLIFHGDKDGAIASAKRVLELDPNNEQATKILDQVDK